MICVFKRDGRQTSYSNRRVRAAISKAMKSADEKKYGEMDSISKKINFAIKEKFKEIGIVSVEEIQDEIVLQLKENGLNRSASKFSSYRKERTTNREMKSDVMKAIGSISKETDRSNANVGNNFSAKLLQIASVSNKWRNLAMMPKEHSKAHENGEIYIHDLDSFDLTINCLLSDLEDILSKEFNTGYGTIRTPKRIESASSLACILLQSQQNDCFGGQGFVEFERGLYKPYMLTIDDEIKKLKKLGLNIDDNEIKKIASNRAKERLGQAMESFTFNVNTMHSRAGSQIPFSSVNIGLPRNDEEALICEELLKAYDRGFGHSEQFIFPNLIFRIKKGVNCDVGDKYRYLRDLAVKVAANRMNPTFLFLDSPQNIEWYEKGYIASRMGCRTNIMENVNGEHGPARRGNNFPVSINMVRIGIESANDEEKYFKILDKRLELCKNQLLYRYDVCKKLKVKDLPFVVGQKLMLGSDNLNDSDSIEEVLKNGTMGIGFIGLAESLVALTGKHHGECEKSQELGLKIIKHMYDRINQFKKETSLNFSLYATPAEGLSGNFTKIDKKKYGIISGVTDREYYTNSNHVPVYYKISASKKAMIEGLYHKYTTAGNIFYVEIDGGDIENKISFINNHIDFCVNKTEISYAAYNFRIRICKECGCKLDVEDKVCTDCGSSSIQCVSRVTGYMSLDERFGPGKKAEREDRLKHL